MQKPSTTRSTWPIVVAATISWVILAYAMYISSTHIIEAAFKVGLSGFAAYTSPILIDAVAVVGKLGRLGRFTDETRRSSLWLFAFGGGMSLTANVYAGANLGQRIHGVLVVVVALWIESHITKLKLKAVATESLVANETATVEPVAPAKTEVTESVSMAELESAAKKAAPVSPAPAGGRKRIPTSVLADGTVVRERDGGRVSARTAQRRRAEVTGQQ